MNTVYLGRKICDVQEFTQETFQAAAMGRQDKHSFTEKISKTKLVLPCDIAVWTKNHKLNTVTARDLLVAFILPANQLLATADDLISVARHDVFVAKSR